MLTLFTSLFKRFMPKSLHAIIDGNKTLFGIIGAAICAYLKSQGTPVPDELVNAFYGLTGIGIMHKVEKFSDLATRFVAVIEQSKKIVAETENTLKNDPDAILPGNVNAQPK